MRTRTHTNLRGSQDAIFRCANGPGISFPFIAIGYLYTASLNLVTRAVDTHSIVSPVQDSTDSIEDSIIYHPSSDRLLKG